MVTVKMAERQAENVIKNIIKEITIEANRKGHSVSETLAAFLVKATVLNPDQDFSNDRPLTKTDVHRLIAVCVEKLLETTSPGLDMVKMQIHFDMNYSKRSEFLEEHRQLLESRLQPITREITDTRARSKDELEGLYRKIVSYILLRSGLGSATDIVVVREASAALQSVFPPSELGSFMVLNKPDKQQQLVELVHIVTGIRLFNKEAGKGGAGIDDLPIILKEAIHTTSQQLETEMRKALHNSYSLTAGLLHIAESPLPPPPASTIALMKQALGNSRQQEQYIKTFMADILKCAEQLDRLESEFKLKMEALQNTVQAKTAVPTSYVYPLFVALSQIWCGFQDEVVLLSVLSNLLSTLTPFTKNVSTVMEMTEVVMTVNQSTVLTDQDRKEQTSGPQCRVDITKHRKAEFFFPESIKNFDSLPLEFAGYCACTLGAYDGLIVPANPSLGILQHRGKYYAFAGKEQADTFASDPDRYLSLAVLGGKRHPELIQLLGLHSHLMPLYKGKDVSLIEAPVVKADAGTQTDTHFMESNMVRSYEWNEWELRRKAIKLANLRQKITHSTQTDLSHYRVPKDTQVYLPREKGLQTKKEEMTKVPQPAAYISGLRGRDLPAGKALLESDVI